MKIMHVMASLLLVSSLATPTTAQERTHKSVTRARHTGSRAAKSQLHPGVRLAHGPSECGEPMWIYGSRSEIARYRNAF